MIPPGLVCFPHLFSVTLHCLAPREMITRHTDRYGITHAEKTKQYFMRGGSNRKTVGNFDPPFLLA